jgi:Protein of unknown function (DUF3176)
MAPAEKSEIAVDSARHSDSESSRPEVEEPNVTTHSWRPGYRARFPVFGAVGLLGVIVFAAATVIVLVCSNHVSSSRWNQKIEPSVVIQGLNSGSNLCLALAIAEGVAIAWWRKALKGATVAELHQSWAYSMSFSSIAKHFWALDAVALAALATKLAIVDGILFQRATSTYTTQDPARNVTILGAAARTFPETGYVVAQGFGAQTDCNCFMIGDTYTPVVDNWETSNGFFKNFEQFFPSCDGICYTYVDTIGFEISCNKSLNHTNYATGAIDAYNAHQRDGSGNSSQWTDLPIFNSSFAMKYPDAPGSSPSLTLDLLYFDSDNPYDPRSDSCPGTMTNVQCTMLPALVRYPVTVVNYTNSHITNGVSIGGRPHDSSNTVSPPIPPYSYTNKQAEGFTVLSYLHPTDQNIINTTTSLGGIANALGQFMSSSAAITYTGGTLWGLQQKGILSQAMMFGPPNMGSCDCSFRDSLSTLVSSVNQLAFLTATNLIDPPAPKTVRAGTEVTVLGIRENTTTTFASIPHTIQISDVIHYQTHYLYMGLGIGSMLGCILLILPAFWRYGELGRDVTLGPFEVASAFRAPMLETGEGDEAAKNLDELIEKVGDKRVQFGFVEEECRASEAAAAAGTGNSTLQKRQSVRLCLDEPARVRPVSVVFRPTSPTIPTIPRSPMSPTSPTSPSAR